MENVEKQSGTGFSLERAKECAIAYSRATGTGCLVLDEDGMPLFAAGEGDCSLYGCAVCSAIQSSRGTESCRKVHRYGCYQAERFGGKYVFFCPLGMVHWVSPITVDGMTAGMLVGGPVHMVQPEEFLVDDFLTEDSLPAELRQTVRTGMDTLPVIPPAQVDALSEMLFVVASHLSSVSDVWHKFLGEREQQEQQSEISEYIHTIKRMEQDDGRREAYPYLKEKRLLTAIATGDTAEARQLLNEILGYIFFSSGKRFDVIKARVLELVVMLSRAALEGGADAEQIFGLNYRYLEEIHHFQNVEDLTLWLSRIMQRFTDCVFTLSDVKHADVIFKAADYIKRNYRNRMSLEEVASQVYLSPSYFSKVFKDETGVTFNQYLNKVRIDVARKLLQDDSIQLVDISSMVGYEDQSYFSKVFKKLVGMTPGRYRESRGRVL